MKSATLVRGTVKEGSADNLIDGLIPTFVKMNQAFENKYVKETEISVKEVKDVFFNQIVVIVNLSKVEIPFILAVNEACCDFVFFAERDKRRVLLEGFLVISEAA